jgi:hypothetical protein
MEKVYAHGEMRERMARTQKAEWTKGFDLWSIVIFLRMCTHATKMEQRRRAVHNTLRKNCFFSLEFQLVSKTKVEKKQLKKSYRDWNVIFFVAGVKFSSKA